MASILDGMPKTAAEMEQVMLMGAGFLGAGIENGVLPEATKPITDKLAKGLSLADIAGLTKEERDAYLMQGCQLLSTGHAAEAQKVLTFLLQLEPTDERTIYMLAAAFQAQGKYSNAGKLYITFLSLDATNPEGYLRLGECFLANKEWDNAEGCFEMAKAVTSDKPKPDINTYADKMLAIVASQKTPA